MKGKNVCFNYLSTPIPLIILKNVISIKFLLELPNIIIP